MDGELIRERNTGAVRDSQRSAAAYLLRTWRQLEMWGVRARERRALLALDDHLLKDIGLSRADAVREGSKPFWRD